MTINFKLILILVLIIVSLVVGVIIMSFTIKGKDKEITRLSSNQSYYLSKGMSIINFKDSSTGAIANASIYKRDEFKDLFKAQVEELKVIGIKIRDLEQYSSTSTETKTIVNTYLRDSTINDTAKVKVFNYTDAWTKIKHLQFSNGKVYQSIKVLDSLQQFVYWERRKGLFGVKWPWCRRDFKQVIKPSNPNSTIKYMELVKIVR